MLFSLVVLLPDSFVWADTQAPTLIQFDQQDRLPSDDVVLQFPYDILDTVTTRLGLEVDSIDVSAMVSIDGDKLIFKPASPFAYGSHQVRLIEYLNAEDDINEIALWEFKIQPTGHFDQQDSQVLVSHNNSFLAADDSSTPGGIANSYYSNGALSFAYEAQGKTFSPRLTGDILYEQDRTLAINGRQLDLGQYLLSVDVGQNAQINLGHHAIASQSLIHQNFNRRGVSGRVYIPGTNSEVELFSMRTGDINGFSDGLGFEDSDNRVSGATVSFQPLSVNPEMLTLSTGYLSGYQKNQDANLGILVEESGGDARNFSLNSQLMDRRLQLYIEVAESSFDADGDGVLLEAIDGDAYKINASYTDTLQTDGKAPWQWGLYAESSRIDSGFHSLSNRHLANDLISRHVNGSLSNDIWNANLFVTVQEDNVDDVFASTNQTGSMGVDVTFYNPKQSPIFGASAFRGIYQQSELDQQGVELDEFLQVIPSNDNETQYLRVSGEFGYEWGHWYTSLSRSSLTGSGAYFIDSDTNITELGLVVQANKYHHINASVSLTDTDAIGVNLNKEINHFIIGVNSSFKRWNMQSYFTLDYQQTNDQFLSEAGFDEDRIVSSLVINRTVDLPGNLAPKVDFQLRGSYFDIANQTSAINSLDGYEILLSVNLNWSKNYSSSSGGNQ